MDPASDPAQMVDAINGVKSSALAVAVRPGCRALNELEGIRESLTHDGRFSDLQALSSWGHYVDVSSGQVVLQVPPGVEAFSALAVDAYGDVIRVEIVDGFELHGRMDDGSPHYGGAAIGLLNNPICTAGYAVDKSGGRWMLTAAHCAADPLSAGYNMASWYSGPNFYGTRSTTAFGYGQDSMLLGHGTHQYSRVIHVDPSSPSTRTVTGKAYTFVSDSVCKSGMVTKNICAITVVQTGWSGSIGGHSYYGLVIGQKGTSVISKPGDSGAPVYRSVGSSSAEIRGHHIGVPGNGTTQTFFMPFSMAESQTGSSVATTCCNGTSY